MKIYRTELDSGIEQKLFEINADQFSSDDIEFYSKKIKGTIFVDNMSNGYHIKGKLDVPYKLTCDRCLTQFNELKEIKFNIILTDDNELNYDESDDIIYFSPKKNEFDLNPLFQELIFLEIQMKILCKPECKGICPNCGTNRNEQQCACAKNADLRPWNVLKNLEGN